MTKPLLLVLAALPLVRAFWIDCLLLLCGFLWGVAAMLVLDVTCGNIKEAYELIADWRKGRHQ
jgi:hypothetical protein